MSKMRSGHGTLDEVPARTLTPKVDVVSTVTGRSEPDVFATTDYWVRQARETVRFAALARHRIAHGRPAQTLAHAATR